MYVNLISSKDTEEIHTIYLRSDKEEIRTGNKTDDIIEGLLNSSLNNYEKGVIDRIIEKRKWFCIQKC